MMRRPPISTLVPYTTLFRSLHGARRAVRDAPERPRPGPLDRVLPRPRRPRARPQTRPATRPAIGWRTNTALNAASGGAPPRSEEHTSELQSRQYHLLGLLLG